MNRLLGMFVILLFTFCAHAQDTLSLARAISIGLKSNFDVRIEQMRVDIARNNNTWGQAGRTPTISLSGNQNNSVVQRKPANPFAVAGRNISDNVNGQLDVQFLLFGGFGVKMNKGRLEELERLSDGNAAFVMETTLQAIILGYYQALLEKERLHILQNNMEFSKERYDWVKLRKELGGAIAFDVLQEQNNYLTDSANVLRQELAYKNSLRQLNLLLNENLTKSYTLVDSLEYQHENYIYEDLRAKMVSSNTNLRNQYTNQEILRYTTKIAQAASYPTLSLNLGGNGSLDQLNANFRTNTGNTIQTLTGYVNGDQNFPVFNDVNETVLLPQTQQGNSYGGYANLSLRFNIFNGGQVKRSIQNARVQEKIAELGTDQLKQSLENDLLANFDLYNLRNQLVSIELTKLEAADLNLELANERYRNGALSAIDLRIVQENARNAALEAYLAIFNSISTKVGLVRLTGGLIDNAPKN
ncbi:MAG: TolC family protein [Cyclobacteriaceae bacterium]